MKFKFWRYEGEQDNAPTIQKHAAPEERERETDTMTQQAAQK